MHTGASHRYSVKGKYINTNEKQNLGNDHETISAKEKPQTREGKRKRILVMELIDELGYVFPGPS